MKLDLEQKVFEALTENPELQKFMVSIGFDRFSDLDQVHAIAKVLTLEKLLEMRGIDRESFVEQFETFSSLNETKQTISKEDSDVIVCGALPCPVKDGMMRSFEEEFSGAESKIYSDFRSANLGTEFFSDNIKSVDDLPDIFISPGFDFPFFNEDTKALFTKENFVVNDEPYNSDFEEFRDPTGVFHIAGAVPAVFLTMKTGDMEDIPRTWDDLLSDKYDVNVNLPMKDLDIVNAVVLTIHSLYGDKGVETLLKKYSEDLHPSEMVKAVLRKKVKKTINIIPYFFGATAVRNSEVELIWPEDGAILSPILMAFKKKNYEKTKPTVDYFKSEKFAKSMYVDGKFPTSMMGIDNNLTGGFKWAGWDYIYNNNLGDVMKKFGVGLK